MVGSLLCGVKGNKFNIFRIFVASSWRTTACNWWQDGDKVARDAEAAASSVKNRSGLDEPGFSLW